MINKTNKIGKRKMEITTTKNIYIISDKIIVFLWTHEISLHKTIHMISTGDFPSPVLVMEFGELLTVITIYNS